MIEGRNYEEWPLKFHDKLIEFPELFKLKKPTANGTRNKNMCRIYVGLVKAGTSPGLFKPLKNATVEELNTLIGLLPMKKHYIDGLPPDNTWAFYVKDTAEITAGDLMTKRKFGVLQFSKTGKNIGKSNSTHCLTQALANAASKYNDSYHKCNSPLVLPMLADGTGFAMNEIKDYIDQLESKHGEMMKQRKYDGNRMLAFYNDELTTYSRDRKPVIIDNELKLLLTVYLQKLNKRMGTVMCLDGELYKHGLYLSKIRSIVSSEEHDEKGDLEYHVFDVFKFDRSESPLKCSERHKLLKTNDRIVKVENLEGDTYELYKKALEDGFEGIMLKLPNKFYEPNSRKNVFKLKPVMRTEYEVISYKEGTGKSKGQLVYEVRQTKKTLEESKKYLLNKLGSVEEPRQTFFVIPKHDAVDGKTSEELHREEFTKMNKVEDNLKTHFENNYKGKLYTVEFNDYSKYSIPLRLKGIGFFTS